MVEYSLSLSKKSFGDIISLLEKQKKKYEEQYPAFPKDCIEIFKGGEMQTDSTEICIAHSRLHFFLLFMQHQPFSSQKVSIVSQTSLD